MEEKVFYLCDRRACKRCHGECNYTRDIAHSVNFKDMPTGLVEINRAISFVRAPDGSFWEPSKKLLLGRMKIKRRAEGEGAKV